MTSIEYKYVRGYVNTYTHELVSIYILIPT